MAESSARHTAVAFDCLNAVKILRYQSASLCEQADDGTTDVTKYDIVQLAQTRELEGIRCLVHRTRFPAMCGVWSHLKIAGVPEISHRMDVSAAWCSEMFSRQKFKLTANSESIEILIGHVNFIQLDEVGYLHRKGDTIECRGQEVQYGGALLKNTVVLSEFRVEVFKVKLRESHEVVEVIDDHVTLPCPLHTGQCEIEAATYIWTAPPEQCQLQFVRTIAATQVQQTFVVDEKNQILLNTTGTTRERGCEVDLTMTQFKHIFLVPAGALAHKMLVNRELELDVQFSVLAGFLYYKNLENTRQLQRKMRITLCTAHQADTAITPVHLDDDQFALRRADVSYLFKCPQVEVLLVQGDVCYEDVPVHRAGEQQQIYMDPVTRVLKKYSSKTVCSKHFPIVVNEAKIWLEIPQLRVVPTPHKGTIEDRLAQLELLDFSHGGLYTQDEIAGWEHLLSFPEFRKAELHQLTLGSCVHQGTCEAMEDTAAYDFAQLTASPTWLNPWAVLQKKADEYGRMASFIMLAYFMLKFIVNLVMLSIAVIQTGVTGGLALFIELFCSFTVAWDRVKRRQARLNREEELDLPLNPGQNNPSGPPHTLPSYQVNTADMIREWLQ